MRYYCLGKVIAWGFLGWAAMGFALPACSNRLGPVIAKQKGGIDRPNFPDIFVERSSECLEIYGRQLVPGQVDLESTLGVNEKRYKESVTINGIPETAPDLERVCAMFCSICRSPNNPFARPSRR